MTSHSLAAINATDHSTDCTWLKTSWPWLYTTRSSTNTIKL